MCMKYPGASPSFLLVILVLSVNYRGVIQFADHRYSLCLSQKCWQSWWLDRWLTLRYSGKTSDEFGDEFIAHIDHIYIYTLPETNIGFMGFLRVFFRIYLEFMG